MNDANHHMTVPLNFSIREDHRTHIGEHEDISNFGGGISFLIQPKPSATPRYENTPTLMDYFEYLAKIETLLSAQLVLDDCLKYGISLVGTSTVYHWLRGEWATYESHEGRKSINLNPNLDRAQVADEISTKHGIDVHADEIYYWIWFRELGHAVSEKAKQYFIAHARHNLEMMKSGRSWISAEVRRLRADADREADEYANNRFMAWKKSSSNA